MPYWFIFLVVLVKGFEPSCLATVPFENTASTVAPHQHDLTDSYPGFCHLRMPSTYALYPFFITTIVAQTA